MNDKTPNLSQRSQFIGSIIHALCALGYDPQVDALMLHGIYRKHLMTGKMCSISYESDLNTFGPSAAPKFTLTENKDFSNHKKKVCIHFYEYRFHKLDKHLLLLLYKI